MTTEIIIIIAIILNWILGFIAGYYYSKIRKEETK